MSYATLALTIALFVNLFVFLAGQPQANAPMIGLLQAVISHDLKTIQWDYLFLESTLIKIGVIAILVRGISWMLSFSPAQILPGSSSFGAVHTLSVIAIAMFAVFFATPDFAFMGLPTTINLIVQVFFGFIIVLALVGLYRGE